MVRAGAWCAACWTLAVTFGALAARCDTAACDVDVIAASRIRIAPSATAQRAMRSGRGPTRSEAVRPRWRWAIDGRPRALGRPLIWTVRRAPAGGGGDAKGSSAAL